MGGSGSGTWYRFNAKATVESHNRIDIRLLRKQNCLIPGVSGTISWISGDETTGAVGFKMEESSMILNYRHRSQGGSWDDVEQVISITQTPCHYGGHRRWFQCPECKKRVGVLYATGKKYFLCRHCYDLTYTCSNASPLKRLFDKAKKLRKRLGGSNDLLLDLIPPRPKNMHRSTYKKIAAEIDRLENFANQWIYNQYGMRL